MKILIIRQGAYGDMLVITPVIRYLKQQGHEIHVLTSDRGLVVLKNNPHIDQIHFIEAKDRSDEELHEEWNEWEKKLGADRTINFTESIEVNLSLHPRSPRYNWTKEERRAACNKNFYEEMFKWANEECSELSPEVFYEESEIEEAKKYIRPGKFNVLVCLSGSGKNKAYPWMPAVMGDCLQKLEDIHFITVGDELCQLLEIEGKDVTNLAGKIPIRLSMALTGLVDLVVSPDTGLLHASGQYDTPKIGILGHTTIENITKHFKNDYSIEADERSCECAPCFRLIYEVSIQCPQDPVSKAAWCMSHGQSPERLFNRIKEVYGIYAGKKSPVSA